MDARRHQYWHVAHEDISTNLVIHKGITERRTNFFSDYGGRLKRKREATSPLSIIMVYHAVAGVIYYESHSTVPHVDDRLSRLPFSYRAGLQFRLSTTIVIGLYSSLFSLEMMHILSSPLTVLPFLRRRKTQHLPPHPTKNVH